MSQSRRDFNKANVTLYDHKLVWVLVLVSASIIQIRISYLSLHDCNPTCGDQSHLCKTCTITVNCNTFVAKINSMC
jgi:hypothetical protein